MITPTLRSSRATLFAVLMLLAAILNPGPSTAIQLLWSSGSTELSVPVNSRVTLIVQADSAESVLPDSWRLQWTADSSGITFVAPESTYACLADTAKVASIDPPLTPADSAANLITAHFCSYGQNSASSAIWTLDLVGGSKGKLRVLALDPADPDSNTVIASNEVTFNGGLDGDYAPVLLHASSTHETAQLRVTVVGGSLGGVERVTVGAPDGLWCIPLEVSQRSSTSLVATADVYVPLPSAVVEAGSASATSGQTFLAPDNIVVLEAESAGFDTILYRDPNPSVYPKDFAFHYSTVYDATDPVHPWKGYFHLFYIRNKNGLASPDSIIAHAWTDSLGKAWSVDTLAFRPSGIGWDKKKVWAPSIQQVGALTYMFYTGVDSLDNQSIGFATTPMLGTTSTSWTRHRTPAYTAADASSWADPIGHQVQDVVQFRDPFIMPDPDNPGRYLLFVAGEHAAFPTHYTVGVARNVQGVLDEWIDLGNYEATDDDHLPLPGSLESPIVVRDSLSGAWRMFVANAQYDDFGLESTIFLTQTPGDSVTDRRASRWPQRDSLFYYTGQDADVIGWQACEHLQIGSLHFFAAFHGPHGICISRMHWDPVSQKFILVYPEVAGVSSTTLHQGVRLNLCNSHPGSGVVRFALEADESVLPNLTLYDTMGRRVRTLTDGRPLLGRVELEWDCRDGSGRSVSSGVYFARLTAVGQAHVLRVVVLR